jgi:5-(carboxyamino)imidazole ribonucleotide synthase
MDTRTGLPVVGMVGGGPLARLTHQAALSLGQSLRLLATAPDDGAAPLAVGGPAESTSRPSSIDPDTLLRFAEGCDVVTVDPRRVTAEHVLLLARAGRPVYPGAQAVRHAQNRTLLWQRLTGLGIPVATDLAAGQAVDGAPGRGTGHRRWSAVVARSPWGQAAAYPVVESGRRDGDPAEVLAPAPGLDAARATQTQRLAIRVATELDVVGLVTVELVQRVDGELVVDDLAMGPHDSAHWTIEGARTSQFEQHLRAVLDYPLGETGMTAPAVVTASVLYGRRDGMGIDERLHHLFADDPAARVHLYGERPSPGRLLGHVTVLGEDLDQVRERARRAAAWLAVGRDSPYGHTEHGEPAQPAD